MDWVSRLTNFAPVSAKRKTLPPLVSAQRELLEETGYGNGNWSELMVIGVNPSTHQPDLLLSCPDVESVMAQHLEDTGRPQRPPSDSRRSKRIVAKRPRSNKRSHAAHFGNTWR